MGASAKLSPSEYGPEMSPEPRNVPSLTQAVEEERRGVSAGINRLLAPKSAPTQSTTDEAYQPRDKR